MMAFTRFLIGGVARRFTAGEPALDTHAHWDRGSRSWRPKQLE